MARAGMANLLARLRRLVDDSNSSTWDDDELQDVLDRHSIRVQRERLEMEKTLVSASDYEYKIYHSRYGNYEEGGTATFNIEGADGTQRGTGDYSVDYIRGVVTMTADQQGSALYLTGRSYDLNAGAADCWREKATTVVSRYDVRADGHSLSRSQYMRQCLDMAKEFDKRARAVTVRNWRHGLFDDN